MPSLSKTNHSATVNSISLEHIRKRLDNSISGIYFTSPFVSLFVLDMKKNIWQDVSYAGPLFVLERSKNNTYSVALLNTKSHVDVYFDLNDTFLADEPVTSGEDEIVVVYGKHKGEDVTLGIYFPNDDGDMAHDFYETITVLTSGGKPIGWHTLPTDGSWKTARVPRPSLRYGSSKRSRRRQKSFHDINFSDEEVCFRKIHDRTMEYHKKLVLSIGHTPSPTAVAKSKNKRKKSIIAKAADPSTKEKEPQPQPPPMPTTPPLTPPPPPAPVYYNMPPPLVQHPHAPHHNNALMYGMPYNTYHPQNAIPGNAMYFNLPFHQAPAHNNVPHHPPPQAAHGRNSIKNGTSNANELRRKIHSIRASKVMG